MTDHTEFESHLDAHPDDWEHRLIYADWLEEQGDVFCETQRWMVVNKKRPFYGECLDINEGWVWWSPYTSFAGLPEMIGNHLQATITETLFPDDRREYPTRHAAELDLHNALVKSGEITCALIEEVV